MKNIDVRNKARENKICLWMVAERLGIQDSALSRKLRQELSTDEKKRIFSVIEELSQEVI